MSNNNKKKQRVTVRVVIENNVMEKIKNISEKEVRTIPNTCLYLIVKGIEKLESEDLLCESPRG